VRRASLPAGRRAIVVKELLPSRRPRACARGGREHEEAKLEDGVRLVTRSLDVARRPASRSTDRRCFDRTSTRALLAQPVEGAEPGSVVEVLQKGYRLGDRVLRPGRGGGRRVTKSPYEVLGRRQERLADEIKKAYRKLARQHHPDANRATRTPRSASRRSRTRTTSLRPEKRKQYDTFGSSNGAAGARGGFNWSATEGFDFGDLGTGDLSAGCSAAAMRGAQRRARGQRGNDVEVQVNLSFEDALHGAEVKIPAAARARLPHCHGSGAKPRNGADHLPGLPRSRRSSREPGLLLDLAAVPALPRQRHDHRRAVPHPVRAPAASGGRALHGQDPGGCEGTARGSG
jgi:hypothetical protein